MSHSSVYNSVYSSIWVAFDIYNLQRICRYADYTFHNKIHCYMKQFTVKLDFRHFTEPH